MKIGIKSAGDFLSLLIRRKWWVIVPAFALSCIVAILVQQLPKIYVSESLVLVRPRDVPEMFVMDLISGTAQQRLRSIQQTVMSRNNTVAILTEFKNKLPEFQSLNMDEAVTKLRSQMDIQFDMVPDARGNPTISSFRIQFEHKNPAVARDIAAKLTTLFIEQDSRTRETHVFGTTEFLQAELDKKELEMSASDEKLKVLKESYQPELPQQLEANLRALDRYSDEKRQNAEAMEHLRVQQSILQEKMAATPQYLSEAEVAGPKKKENPFIEEYKKLDLNLKRLKASVPPGSTLPDLEMTRLQMEGLKKQIPPDEFEAAMKEEEEEKKGTEKKVDNPQYIALNQQARLMNTEISRIEKDKALIETNYRKYSARVDATPKAELKLSEVLRENIDIRGEYERLKGKLTEAKLAESLESKQRGDQFMVLDPANFPIEPSKPNKWKVLIIGFLICLGIGVGLALLSDVMRQRVWTQSEVESFWGVPVMIDIPEIITDGDVAVAQRRRRVVALSSVAAFAAYSVCLYLLYLRTSYILEQLDPVLQKVVYR
jgi:polysaccharide chain length determinant protein (PEP-CTERM system associated)